MEVVTATTAAGEPPRPRRVLMTRSGAMGALAARVGWRHGKICSGRDHHIFKGEFGVRFPFR